MAQKLQPIGDAPEEHEEGDTRGPKSTIVFPYSDEDMAVEVAKTIWAKGGRQCTIDQLSSYLGHDSVTSGAFRLKYTTARIFGLIEVSQDEVRLTTLGCEIIDPTLERKARVEAFLSVPLYKRLYEKYKGYPLPQGAGLKQELITLGVTPKQADKARQSLQRSAQQAGFFEQGRNKLVLPSGLGSPNASVVSRNTRPLTTGSPQDILPSPHYTYGGDGGDGGSQVLHTLQENALIHNLYVLAPPIGTKWSRAKREAWLALLATVIHSLYSDEE